VTLLVRERASDPQAQLQEALDQGFSYLGHRDRTVAEVRRHLERKRIEPGGIDAALAELQRMGYLDDARFVQRFAEDRRRLDGWGTDRIERRLTALGIEPGLIASGLTGEAGHDELAAAIAVLKRRFQAAPSTDRERERALGLLARRGYELDLAYEAVRSFERHG
jgi:regulatory protein